MDLVPLLLLFPAALLAWKTIELVIDLSWTIRNGEAYAEAALDQLPRGSADFNELDCVFGRRQPLRQATTRLAAKMPNVGRQLAFIIDVAFRAPSLMLVAVVIVAAGHSVLQHAWFLYLFVSCVAGLIVGTILVELFQLVVFGAFNPYKRDWALRPSTQSRSTLLHSQTWELRRLMSFMISIIFISIVGFASIYYALYFNDHSHFNFAQDNGSPPMTSLYFSAVTMATVGYGEIHPMSDVARALVLLQILTGPLALILVIPSWLSRQRLKS